MPDLVGKVIDFLSKPINISIVIAVFLTSLAITSLNLLSEEILVRLKVLTFLNEYGFIFVISLLGSFFFLIIQVVMLFFKRNEDKKRRKYLEEQQENLFNDPDAYKILKYLYSQHPENGRLPIQNQKVNLLSRFGLIVRISNQTHLEYYEDMNNPMFPYVLQPVAEQRLRNELGELKKTL